MNQNQLSIYKVSGDDASQFLQGQLTQDMQTVESQWRYAAHCNPKGRVLSLFMLFSKQGNYYLTCPEELIEDAINGIKKYVMRSKVKFEKLEYFQTFSESTGQSDSNFKIELDEIRLAIPEHGELIFNADNTASPEQKPQWDHARIQSLVPRLYKETVGLFTPEELSLDINDAVSFTKGCYTGQEIVARMHYLGKAKRRLFLLSIEESKPININDEVLSLDGKKVGLIIDNDQNSNSTGTTTCLASMKADTQECLVNGATITIVKRIT